MPKNSVAIFLVICIEKIQPSSNPIKLSFMFAGKENIRQRPCTWISFLINLKKKTPSDKTEKEQS